MNRCYVIAEAGVNHNGDLGRARALVAAAARAGADAVKFQSFSADRLVTCDAKKAAYQQKSTGGDEPQYPMLKRLELSRADHLALKAECEAHAIEFLSTPFDRESLTLLVEAIGVSRLKLPSGEISNGPLLLAAALSGLPLIVSTGMSDLNDIAAALDLLAFGYLHGRPPTANENLDGLHATPEGRQRLVERVTLLHCTTEYPAPLESVNLRAMATLAERFGTAVGYSDHTTGLTIPTAATALGATVIEKHFTLDRSLPGPDHRASLEPDELTAMVEAIRQVEMALGGPNKEPAAIELDNRKVVRQSLVALRPITAGEPFSERNLGSKRPGDGISPMHYWRLLGRAARHDYAADEALHPDEEALP